MDSLELTNEELTALEEELNTDWDHYDANESDHEIDALETKLRTALHNSENDNPNPLSSLAGFANFTKSTQVMNDAIESFKDEISEVRKMENAAVSKASEVSNPEARGIDNLSAADVFALAIGAATRGAVSYLVSETEMAIQREADAAREKILKDVEAERAKKEEDILQLQKRDYLEQEERLREKEEARAAAKELSRLHAEKIKKEMEEIERQAQEEHEREKLKVEEEQRQRKQNRIKIAESEEKRWTVASRAVGFVQSRLRGLLGRKKAEQKKKERKMEREGRVASGFARAEALVNGKGLRRGLEIWRVAVEDIKKEEEAIRVREAARRVKEEECALTIQTASRGKLSRSRVFKIRKEQMEAEASLKIQCLARRCASARRVGGMIKARKLEEENRMAREEAARRYEEEKEKERIKKELERIEKERAGVKLQCLREMEERAEVRRKQAAEQKRAMGEAEDFIERSLFGGGGGRRGLGRGDANFVWEERRKAMILRLKGVIESWGATEPLVHPHGDDFDCGDDVEGGGQEIEEVRIGKKQDSIRDELRIASVLISNPITRRICLPAWEMSRNYSHCR